jgi:RNase P subunit RPR2
MKQGKRNIAYERIEYLFELLEKEMKKKLDLEFLQNIVAMIYRIRKKFNIRLDQKQKMKFCKKCFAPYINPKIRIRKIKKDHIEHVQKIIICGYCEYESRFTIKEVS